MESQVTLGVWHRMAVAVVTVLVGFLAAGCAVSGENFAPAEKLPPNKGVVYVYRQAGIGMRRPDIVIDETNIGALNYGGCYGVVLPAGLHTVTAPLQGSAPVAHVSVEPGKSYYVEYVGMVTLTEVSAAQGVARAAKCRMEKPVITDLASIKD